MLIVSDNRSPLNSAMLIHLLRPIGIPLMYFFLGLYLAIGFIGTTLDE